MNLLLSVAAAVLIVAAVSWFLAHTYGGQSRRKKRVIFEIASSLGVILVGVMIYVKVKWFP